MSGEIKICGLMLDPYDVSPGQRFRIEQWQPFLKEENITIDYFSFTDDGLRGVIYQQGQLAAKIKELGKAYLRRVNHIFAANKYDVVFLYRAASMIGPALLERILRWQNPAIIFDFDDAIFLTNTSKANSRFGWTKFAGKTAEICRLSDSVTVGNSYLADYARQYNDSVTVIPSSIDTVLYQPQQKIFDPNKKVIIGWTGSSTSQYHLEEFEPTLVELLKLRPDAEIRVLSNRKPDFKQIGFVWREWSAATEIEETKKFDIGIMPLPDDEWARGKCAMKALIYMSLGIPPVCSDVGVNGEVVAHNRNGFLAKTPEEWLTALTTLIDNRELRYKLGDNARQTVVDHYSMRSCAAQFAEVVRKTARAKNQSNKAAAVARA